MSIAATLLFSTLTLLAVSVLGVGLWAFPQVRKARGKKILASSLASGVTGVVLFVLVVPHEQVFLFNPQIDTVYASHYTATRFSKIIPGMSRKEVIRLIGQPLSVDNMRFFGTEAAYRLNYSRDGGCRWGDFAWEAQGVVFDQHNKVLYTSSAMNKD